MVLGEKDQPFPRPFRFRDPVFEEELAGARLIPGLKGGILQVPEGSLSVTIVLVSPNGPVLGYEVPEIFLRVVV